MNRKEGQNHENEEVQKHQDSVDHLVRSTDSGKISIRRGEWKNEQEKKSTHQEHKTIHTSKAWVLP